MLANAHLSLSGLTPVIIKSLQVAESPKLAKKLVTELERLPNGSFVAAPQTEVSVESTSPRTKRAVKPKENADEKSLENTLTPGIEL